MSAHRKKAIFLAFIAGIYALMKHARKTRRFEQTLSQLEKKVQNQIETEFKARAELLRKNANFDSIYSYFTGLDKAMKRSMKKEIDTFFQIDTIKAELRKNITPEQKKNLWDNLKHEIFTQAVFTAIYIPIVKTIYFIRECIINAQESALKEKQSEDYQTLEVFLSELSELVVIEGGKKLYDQLKEELKPSISELKVTGKYKKDQILDLLEEFKQRVIAVETGYKRHEGLRHVWNGEDTDRIRRMLVEGEKKRGKLQALKKKDWNALPAPVFRVKILKAFTSIIEGMRVTEEKEIYDDYCKEIKENQRNLIAASGRLERDFLALENGEGEEEERNPEDGALVVRSDMRMEEVKEEEKGKQKTGQQIIEESGNEFMDIVEGKNLGLLSMYLLSYEFEKLKNRVTLFFKAKGGENEEMLLANFLPGLQKIMQEEFISEEAEDLRENFYNMKIKACLGYMRNKEATAEEMEISYKILLEAEMRKEIDMAFKEFGKRVYMGEDYEKANAKKESGPGGADGGKGLEMLLNSLSGTQLGGAAQDIQ